MNETSLYTLTIKYFAERGYSIERNVAVEGFSGLLQTFDLLIKKGREEYPIIVKEWKRTVGVNIIIKTDKASEDAQLPRPIIVAKKFSDHAKSYANRKRVILMTEREIVSRL